jgi:hypothetical protein
MATDCRFETGEHGGDYPDNMPQAITVTDAQGRRPPTGSGPVPRFGGAVVLALAWAIE